MNESKTESKNHWQKSPVPNLVRFVASGVYFARIRVKGKLIRRSLKTKTLSVAKLRLADLEKSERQMAEHSLAYVGTLTGPQTGVAQFIDTNPPTPQSFYRTISP